MVGLFWSASFRFTPAQPKQHELWDLAFWGLCGGGDRLSGGARPVRLPQCESVEPFQVIGRESCGTGGWDGSPSLPSSQHSGLPAWWCRHVPAGAHSGQTSSRCRACPSRPTPPEFIPGGEGRPPRPLPSRVSPSPSHTGTQKADLDAVA